MWLQVGNTTVVHGFCPCLSALVKEKDEEGLSGEEGVDLTNWAVNRS